MATLIERLIAAQQTLGWTDEQIARRIGVKLRMWQLLKSGTYRLSKRSLGLVLIHFPGLREDVLAYLVEEAMGSEGAVLAEERVAA